MRLTIRLLAAAWTDLRRWAGERVDVGARWANETSGED